MKTYAAPWSRLLIGISSFGVLVLLGVAISAAWHQRPWVAVIPLALLCGGFLFVIRGYAITPDAILVRRLFWTTRLPRSGLISARAEPNAMSRSFRMFGNGGLFAFSGWYRSTALGSYRAFVTDPQQTVVLRYPKHNVVISPSAPDAFVIDLG